jgi:phosphoribulokinase
MANQDQINQALNMGQAMAIYNNLYWIQRKHYHYPERGFDVEKIDNLIRSLLDSIGFIISTKSHGTIRRFPIWLWMCL